MSRVTFPADSSVVADVRPSPNQGERIGTQRPDMIVLHYTGMSNANAALDLLCTPGSGVSAHYFVFEDGRIIQLVQENRRAWHAGSAFWAGETDINSCSIGIEIANPGHEHGYPDFPKRQIAATTALCRSILTRNTVPPVRVLAHSDIAPARKQGSDSHSMNFAGDFAVLQMGDQRHADWISNFVPCAEWVGGRERK